MRSARRKGCGVSASAIAVSSVSSAVIARVRVARRAAVTHSLVAIPRQRLALRFLRIIEQYLCGLDLADF